MLWQSCICLFYISVVLQIFIFLFSEVCLVVDNMLKDTWFLRIYLRNFHYFNICITVPNLAQYLKRLKQWTHCPTQKKKNNRSQFNYYNLIWKKNVPNMNSKHVSMCFSLSHLFIYQSISNLVKWLWLGEYMMIHILHITRS